MTQWWHTAPFMRTVPARLRSQRYRRTQEKLEALYTARWLNGGRRRWTSLATKRDPLYLVPSHAPFSSTCGPLVGVPRQRPGPPYRVAHRHCVEFQGIMIHDDESLTREEYYHEQRMERFFRTQLRPVKGRKKARCYLCGERGGKGGWGRAQA